MFDLFVLLEFDFSCGFVFLARIDIAKDAYDSLGCVVSVKICLKTSAHPLICAALCFESKFALAVFVFVFYMRAGFERVFEGLNVLFVDFL